MADFTALKTAIQNAIKQNGNEEITGNLLQEVLLAIVTTLGDGSINDLVTALGSEATIRGNADSTLQQNIDAEAQARGNADTALGGRIDGVIESINAIKTAIGNGYVYAGIATPSSTPTTGKVFYLALTSGTYTNFGNIAVTQGINILKYNGSAWSLDAFIGIDDTPTPSSNNLVKSSGVFNGIMTNGSAFDLTAYNNGTTYADLNAALTALNALPAAYKKGGMSMKYVQTSDNKYVQFRYMGTDVTGNPNPFLDTANWQGVDDEPTAGSDNLAKSGGVFEQLTPLLDFASIQNNDNYIINGSGNWLAQGGAKFKIIPVKEGDKIIYTTSVVSVLKVLSAYSNPVAGQSANVLEGLSPEEELTCPQGSKYLYVLVYYNSDRTPTTLTINGRDIISDTFGTPKIQNDAITFAKRTHASNMVYYSGILTFDTTNKTLKISQQFRVYAGMQLLNVNPFNTGFTINVSSQEDAIVALDITKADTIFSASDIVLIPTSSTSSIVFKENYVVLCAYTTFGKDGVSCNGKYIVDGEDKGINVTDIGSYGLLVQLGGDAPLRFDSYNKTCTIGSQTRLITRTKYVNLNPFTSDLVIDISGTEYGLIVATVTKDTTTLTASNISVMSIASSGGNALTKDSIILAAYNGFGKYGVCSPSAYLINGNLYGIQKPIDVISPTFETISLPSEVQWWSDFITININGEDEMWFFEPSSDETHTSSNGRIRRVKMSDWSYIGKIEHNLGHCNNVQYDAVSDTLIIGNLPGNETYPSAIYIFYNVSSWASQSSIDFNSLSVSIIDVSSVIAENLSAFFGENSFGKRNIVYLIRSYSANKVGYFAKIVLGMGTNQLTYGTYNASYSGANQFNGTFDILVPTTRFENPESYDVNKNVVQGGDYYNSRLITANGHDQIFGYIWSLDLQGKIQRQQINTCPRKADGTIDYCVGEGLCVKDGYVYHGCIKISADFRGEYTVEGYYLAKYPLPH